MAIRRSTIKLPPLELGLIDPHRTFLEDEAIRQRKEAWKTGGPRNIRKCSLELSAASTMHKERKLSVDLSKKVQFKDASSKESPITLKIFPVLGSSGLQKQPAKELKVASPEQPPRSILKNSPNLLDHARRQSDTTLSGLSRKSSILPIISSSRLNSPNSSSKGRPEVVESDCSRSSYNSPSVKDNTKTYTISPATKGPWLCPANSTTSLSKNIIDKDFSRKTMKSLKELHQGDDYKDLIWVKQEFAKC